MRGHVGPRRRVPPSRQTIVECRAFAPAVSPSLIAVAVDAGLWESAGGGYSERSAQARDDRAAQRDGDERAEEAGLEEPVAQIGQEDELDGDDRDCDGDCGVARKEKAMWHRANRPQAPPIVT
jgi:hypothetical protein